MAEKQTWVRQNPGISEFFHDRELVAILKMDDEDGGEREKYLTNQIYSWRNTDRLLSELRRECRDDVRVPAEIKFQTKEVDFNFPSFKVKLGQSTRLEGMVTLYLSSGPDATAYDCYGINLYVDGEQFCKNLGPYGAYRTGSAYFGTNREVIEEIIRVHSRYILGKNPDGDSDDDGYYEFDGEKEEISETIPVAENKELAKNKEVAEVFSAIIFAKQDSKLED